MYLNEGHQREPCLFVTRLMPLLNTLFHYMFVNSTEPSGMVVAEVAWVHSVLQFFEVVVHGALGDIKCVVIRIRRVDVKPSVG